MMSELVCPICGATTNRSGAPFVSDWALASHVAGSIRYGDRLHISWAKHNTPEVDLYQSQPLLATALSWPLRQAIETDHRKQAAPAPTPIAVLHEIEVKLHRHIRRRLEEHFGVEGERWWADGVPLQVRQQCAQLREADPARDESYKYTYLIDLKIIVEKNWALFQDDHTRVRESLKSKKDFLNLLMQLNEVRNRHSHPSRSPDRSSADFKTDQALVREASELLARFCG